MHYLSVICFSGAMLPPDLGDFYGSDGAVFPDDSSCRHRQVSCLPTPTFLRMSSTPTISPWKMNKAELVDTLVQMGIPVRKEWTVPELRSIISEQKEDPHHNELKGLSSMKLDKLITKAREAGIEIPAKPTRGQRTSHSGGAGTVWPAQGLPLLRGALQLLGLGDHRDNHGRQQLTGLDPACPLGQGEQVQEGRHHLQEQGAGLQGPGVHRTERTSTCGAASQVCQPRGSSSQDGIQQSLSQDEEQDSSEQKDADIELLRRRGLLHDRGHRQLPEDRGPGKDCQGPPGSARRVKSRAGIFNLFGGKQNYEVSSEDIGDSNETVDLVPKVNLHYPDDYVQVRKLPSHKMKRVARKRVRSWARQTLGCLMTTLLCYSAGDDRAKHRPGEVVGRTKHMAYVSTWRRRRTGCPLGTFLWSCPIDP